MTTDATASAILSLEAVAAQQARAVVRGLCEEAVVAADSVDTAVLLTSELVANAVIHGGGPTTLDARVQGSRLRITVGDHSSQPPVVVRTRHTPHADEGGRGLFLVSVLASRWGYAPSATAKTVWFELDLN